MSKQGKIYTVSQVNSLIKATLENELPSRFSISGEITDFKAHQSGHCYFSLKDENSKLPCVMWRSKAGKVKFEIENGLAVLAKGFVDVYVPHGKYQFYVDSLRPAGIGDLQLAFEQLVRRLEAEGLFKDEHKRPLPVYPQRIGIVTSESGAAVADISNSIFTRWPCVELFLYPVAVQGEGAAGEIASAIRDVNRRNAKLKLDILIVGRGGGSLEDLWAFNEEVVARAIFESEIPIISAVGHEVDVTVSDLVADKRASTPTKAGITAVPDKREVLGQLEYFGNSLTSKVRWNLEFGRENLQTLLASSVFRNPLLPVINAGQQLDEIGLGLADLIKEMVAEARDGLAGSYEVVISLEPHRLLGKRNVELNDLQNRLDSGLKGLLHGWAMELSARANRLEGLNPKLVLQRGYSITTSKETGLLVRKLGDVKIEDLMITEIAGGNLIESCVTNKQNIKNMTEKE